MIVPLLGVSETISGEMCLCCLPDVSTDSLTCRWGFGNIDKHCVLCRANCTATRDLCHASPIVNPVPARQPPTQAQCIAYTWAAGSWSACNTSCGAGVQSRNVACFQYDASLVLTPAASNSLCSSAARPSSVTECSAGPCVPVYPAACLAQVFSHTASSGRKLFANAYFQ